MRILITGGAGFIGSAVARLAISEGYQVIIVDSLTYASCEANLTSISSHQNYIFEKVDIRDLSALRDVFAIHKPDSVMHLAAESHVDRSIDAPENFITTNIVGTFNLLSTSLDYWRSIGKLDIFRFHHISTDEVFGSLDETGMFTENTPYNPKSPYSASKAGSDHLVEAWGHTYKLPTLLTNCSNNYGPYQFPEKLIPVIIINALMELPIPIYGKGQNVRDWLHVDDHAEALLLVLKNGEVGSRYNIGGGNEINNLDLAYKICGILDGLLPRKAGRYSELINFVNDRPGHDFRYAIDGTRIKDKLNWEPSINIDKGLEKTVAWYIKNPEWWESLMKRNGVGHRLGTNA